MPPAAVTFASARRSPYPLRLTPRFELLWLTGRNVLAEAHRAKDWEEYRMDYRDPYRRLEPVEEEVAVVAQALGALRKLEVIPCTAYDHEALSAHRQAVRRLFEVPWTAITPRMERLIYALNAIHRPRTMIAAGVFCGFTFICNAGAAVGPGKTYDAEDLIGVEIDPERAQQAEENVRRLDETGTARVVAADAVPFVKDFADSIDLLYLDADGTGGRGKAVYLDILEAAGPKLRDGALVLAHNSVNCADELKDYLRFVRRDGGFRHSVNMYVDPEGLEVSLK